MTQLNFHFITTQVAFQLCLKAVLCYDGIVSLLGDRSDKKNKSPKTEVLGLWSSNHNHKFSRTRLRLISIDVDKSITM